jgi:hypothetical protein
MATVIKLPSGNTVTVKDEKEYSLKDRKFVFNNLKQDDLDNISDMMDVLERVVVVSVTEWSFDLIPPNIKADSMETLNLQDVDVLFRHAKNSLRFLMPNLNDEADGSLDPKVTTPNSDD